jgi:hypothetical protein
MTTPFGPILSMWEAEGHRHAEALDACAGAVIIGERPSTAAEVALGIARVQARRRRVAVADTVGELGPLEDLVPMDAPYGLVDSFFYGVSLQKIAYTVDPAKNLIIFPSGATPIDHEALLSSDRWVKLLDGFRAAEGLLLIVAPAESSALSALIQVMDGVVLVGNVAAAPGTRVLAHARLPVIPARPTPVGSTPISVAAIPQSASPPPPPSPPLYSAVTGHYPPEPPPALEQHDEPQPHDGADEEHAAHEEPAEREEREGETALVPPWAREDVFNAPATPPPGTAKTLSFWIAIIVGAIIAAALLTWATTAMLSRGRGVDSFNSDSARTLAHAAAAGATANAAKVAGDSGANIAAADSAPYSVVLADVSSATGANSELDLQTENGMPAVTYAPYARADGGLSYTILAGAARDSAGADSLLQVVRAKKFRNAQAAHVVRLPYAVRIQTGVSTDQASMFVHAYVSKGLPVYPLVQSDGSATLYAGAFRTIEQAQPLMTSFRANGDQPTVTIRTGRAF